MIITSAKPSFTTQHDDVLEKLYKSPCIAFRSGMCFLSKHGTPKICVNKSKNLEMEESPQTFIVTN